MEIRVGAIFLQILASGLSLHRRNGGNGDIGGNAGTPAKESVAGLWTSHLSLTSLGQSGNLIGCREEFVVII